MYLVVCVFTRITLHNVVSSPMGLAPHPGNPGSATLDSSIRGSSGVKGAMSRPTKDSLWHIRFTDILHAKISGSVAMTINS